MIEIDFFRNRSNFDNQIVWQYSSRNLSIILNFYFLQFEIKHSILKTTNNEFIKICFFESFKKMFFQIFNANWLLSSRKKIQNAKITIIMIFQFRNAKITIIIFLQTNAKNKTNKIRQSLCKHVDFKKFRC